MPNTGNKRFDVASYMKARKDAREKLVNENRQLASQYKKLERVREKVQWKDK